MSPILESGTVVNRRYKVLDQLSHYKELFRCVDENTGEEVVLKVEAIDGNDSQRLSTEWRLYQKLSTTQCFNFVINYFNDNEFRYLFMKPLGPNLYEFWKQKRKTKDWSLEVVVKYADEMISRVANCHLRGVIHRDIKPENFVVDRDDNNYLYLIDFNLAKEYSNSHMFHIPYRIRSPKFSIGNVQFLSPNAHKGEEQSRRDDLLSIGYTLIYIAKDGLPWTPMRSKDYKTRYDYIKAVGKVKLNCSVDQLCEGLPLQFREYMDYCFDLKFDETPDYFKLRQMFIKLLNEIKSSKAMPLVQCLPHMRSEIQSKSENMKCRQQLSQVFETSPQMKCP